MTRRRRSVVVVTSVQQESTLSTWASTPLQADVDGVGRPDDDPRGAADYADRLGREYGLSLASARTMVAAPNVPHRRDRALADVLRRQLRASLGDDAASFTPLQDPLYAVAEGADWALWLGDSYHGGAGRRTLIPFSRRPG